MQAINVITQSNIDLTVINMDFIQTKENTNKYGFYSKIKTIVDMIITPKKRNSASFMAFGKRCIFYMIMLNRRQS